MKIKIITLAGIISLLASCSESEDIKISDAAENTAYVEYLFCKNGPDMSQESFAGMLSEWNTICLLYTSPSPRD